MPAPTMIAQHIEGSVALTFGPNITTVSSGATAGATAWQVAASVFTAGMYILLLDGVNTELVHILSVAVGTNLTTSPLLNTHGSVNVVQATIISGGFGPRSPYLTGG